ncbi:MAG: amidoligase family protein [Gammaproteobacteria bacterium]|nr:amidoligase family protein [Gammaproteobacteria bacterium]
MINHPEFGKFELELDWQFLKDQAREDYIQADVMKLIGDIAGTVVPLELVFPPIDVTRVDETDEIIKALRDAGASGTHESPCTPSASTSTPRSRISKPRR